MQKTFTVITLIAFLFQLMPPILMAQDAVEEPAQMTTIFLPFIGGPAISLTEATDDIDDAGLTEIQINSAESQAIAASQRSLLQARSMPSTLAALQMDTPMTGMTAALRKVDAGLRGRVGRARIVVRLREPSVAEFMATNLVASAVEAQQAQWLRVQSQQEEVVQAAIQLDGAVRTLATLQRTLNAVILEMDAAAIPQLAANPAVLSINPVIDYEKDLSETVPYIGAAKVQAAGFNGAGVDVAILDSGIDYLHSALGGAGNAAEYAANDPTIIEPGSFPTSRVVGGYDFVGSAWTGGANTPPEAPDPDPVDDGPEAGHGTAVADIIGGNKGVAPGVNLYAVKVCSSVATLCSGLALLQGMDFALDPNGDGAITDAVDVINLSLGRNYGAAFDDDLSLAVEVASAAGVVVVASAGNSGDKPYAHGSPSSSPSTIAVAQTEVPSAILPVLEITAPAEIAGQYEAIFQPWSVLPTTIVSGPVQYGDGAGGNLLGCNPFTPGSLAGKIVLVNRGGCNFTLKIANIGQSGGLAGLIGLVTPGDPFTGADGGDRPINIPGYMISQANATKLKSGLAAGVVAQFDPNNGLPGVMHIVGSSSRGPTMGANLIKPDIGAPGASIAAVAGSGSGVTPFGGTSGAAPMVSGAVALLRQAYPHRSVPEIKALLMNTAETNIMNKAALFGGNLAPITRIGGGEVRVDRALSARAAAWDVDALSGSLSFGFHDVTKSELDLTRRVNVRNYSDHDITFKIKPEFRFAADALNKIVEVDTPREVFVPAHGDAQFDVEMEIEGKLLGIWPMNSGARGASPAPLTQAEYDGYLQLIDKNDASNQIHLAWQVLPRPAGDVSLTPKSHYIKVKNRGVGTTVVESYSLLASSGNLPEGGPGEQNPTPDLRYAGYATIPVPAGVCSDTAESFVLAFAINTWERQTHANAPASFDVLIDVDQDGKADYDVFSFDASLSGQLSDGRNVTWVGDLKTGASNAFFFTEHETNSGNMVLLICAEQIGMTTANYLDPMDVAFLASDWYFQGKFTDELTGITIAPLGERYIGKFETGGVGATTLGYKVSDKLQVLDLGPGPNNTESGLLLLFRGGAPINREAGVVIIVP